MWRAIPLFSFSVGERKFMNHFVVTKDAGLRFASSGLRRETRRGEHDRSLCFPRQRRLNGGIPGGECP